MDGWRDCKLGDLLEIKHGYAFLGEHFVNAGSHIVLTPGNFHDEGGFKHKGDKEKWYNGPIPNDYVLNQGDLIVAMTEQAEGLLGSSAIIPRSGIYLHNQRLWQRQRDHGLPPQIDRVALRKLTQLHRSRELRDMRLPPGNRLEALKGDRALRYSIRINNQWRICFRWHEGSAYDVEIVDYH